MRSKCNPWLIGFVVGAAWLSACGGGPDVDYEDLLDEDPHIRADAALRLGQAKAVDAVDSLMAVLNDPDEVVRVTVVRALGDIGDPKPVPAIVEMVDDPLNTVRMASAQALGRIGDPRGLAGLAKLMYDDDENMRLAAATNIGKIKVDEALELLLTTALRDESEWVRQHVIQVVKARGAKQAIPRVENALVGEADLVRAHAARALGKLGDRSSVPLLAQSLTDDPFYKVRSLSAHSLYEIGPDDPEIRKLLAARLEEEKHQLVRVDLAWNVTRMGDETGLEVLRYYLLRGDPEEVRAEAAMALGDVGDSSDIPRLQKAATDKKGLVREQALSAIQRLKKA